MKRASLPYYEQHGAGEPLVLLMGIAADARAWALQLPALSARHRTIVIDNRGIGRSPAVESPYTISDLADDVVAVLDRCEVERAHVIGLSMGGMIAQELALAHPSRVDRLMLVATAPACHPKMNALCARFRSVLEESPNGAAFWRHAMPALFSRAFLASDWETLLELFGSATGLSVPGILAQLDAVERHDTRGRLGSLATPTLVVTGADDQVVPPECSEALARQIPGARLRIVEGGSHCFNIELADAFNRVALEFLDRRADAEETA